MPSIRTFRIVPAVSARALSLSLALIPAASVAAAPADPRPVGAAPAAATAPATAPAALGAGQVFASWATAALFRLEAMRYAAEEAPLPEGVKPRVAARVAQARAEVDGVASRYAAGTVRSTAARKEVDGILARLAKDADALLGDRSAAFAARVEKTMADVQFLTVRNAADTTGLLDAAVKLDDGQKAVLGPVLSDAAARVAEIDSANGPDAQARRHQVGFATRAAVRRVLTPAQREAFDGPFAAAPPTRPSTGPRPGPPASSRPATAATGADPSTGSDSAIGAPVGVNEVRAATLARLEAMRYAVLEGPYPPEVKVELTRRVARGKADADRAAGQDGAGPATRPEAAGPDAAARVSRVYPDVLADAAKLLKDQTPDFIRRQDRIYQDADGLSAGGPWRGRAALDWVNLTAAQKAQVGQILARCAAQLDAPGPASGTGPAASLRRHEIAFEARAALRAVLTPDQQAAWDAAR